MKFKKIMTCFLAAAIAAGGVLTGSGSYTYRQTEIVSAAVSVPTAGTSLKEAAYITWTAIDGADGYNVYVKPEGGSYTQIDSMLVRQYQGYYRADAVGLKAGKYIMKVVPTKNGNEDTSKAVESSAMTVESYDRSGFAFSSNAPNPTEGVGAYNNDGTLKSNAMVIYVTEDTKKTVTATINGTTQTGIANITQQAKKCNVPMCFRIIGEVTLDGISSGDMSSAYAMGVKEASNVTIEGIGDDATLNGAGLAAFKCTSIEMRNVALMLWGGGKDGDGITLKESQKAWIHNIDFFYGAAGSDSDQVKGDGSMDLKDDSQYITISYNHFWDSGKMSLCGMKSESGENWITYHHNWFDHSDSRHPRIRTMSVHAYNNYYDGNSKYGVGVTYSGNAFVEANYFRNCNYPMLISMQGSDIISGGTFSSENGGMIKAYSNVIEGAKSYITQSDTDDKQGIDAYEASSRNEKVPSDYKAKKGGTSYNNFDTDSSIMYTYTADAAKDVPAIVKAEAGRLNGGDFDFTFTSADDTDYSVNSNLMSALKAYKTSVIAIGSGFTNKTETTQPTTQSTTVTTKNTSATTKTTTVTTKSTGEVVAPEGIKVVYSGGWNEMAYLVVSGLKDADVKGVSYSGAATGSLSGEDFENLVRDTNDGLRVDLLGLKAGSYTIKLDTSKGTVSQSGINVTKQDRSGYAHFNYTDGVGAYNDDGTLKANAKVLYVNDSNKNTVSVTSKDGTKVVGIGNILNSMGMDNGSGKTSNGGKPNTNAGIIKKLAEDGTPLVVRIVGNVTAPDGVTVFDSVDYGGSVGDNGYMARMKSGKNITIEGVGNDAVINGWGFHFMAESSAPDLGKSFEVRNIEFRNVPEDCIGMEGVQEGSALTASVERCWIHNCEFYVPKVSNPAESDKAEGDGACDFKRGYYFTNSYCYYEGYHKTNLVGASDNNLQFHLTYHHNYWSKCESRGPLARQANIHMYNNVFDGQTSYCMNPRANAYIFSEYNVFKDSKNPMQVKLGAIKSYNDEFTNVKGDQQGTIVTDKSQKVDTACKYANFDTDSSVSYIPSGNYDLTTSNTPSLYEVLKAEFEDEGGCMDNGKVNSSNSNPTTTASTSQNPQTNTTVSTTTKKPNSNVPSAGGYVHDFTANGKESTYYTITGNLSTGKGTVEYDGKKLTQCLKMESSTNVGFTAANSGKITLVFVEPAATIKIDGTKYTASNGIVEAELKAGAHTITKADTANLFYMVYNEDGASQVTTATTAKTDVTTTTTSEIPTTTLVLPKAEKYGDVNRDDKVDVADIVKINLYLLNSEAYPLKDDVALANADCMRDNIIDGKDSSSIMNYVAMIVDIIELGKVS